MPRRFALLMAAIAAALSGATVAGAVPAAAAAGQAAAGCFSTGPNSCAGKNPNSMGCAASATPRETYPFDGLYTLQLRYSAGCYAFWGRLVRDDCGTGQGFAHLRVQRQLRSPYGWYNTHTYYAIQSSINCSGGVGYTYMVPNSGGEDDRFRACVSIYPTTSPGGIPESQWSCHSWHVF